MMQRGKAQTRAPLPDAHSSIIESGKARKYLFPF